MVEDERKKTITLSPLGEQQTPPILQRWRGLQTQLDSIFSNSRYDLAAALAEYEKLLRPIDFTDPDTLKRPGAPDATAWGLHGGLHRKLPHARCVLHVHPRYATVLASLKDSTIYPIDQNAMRFYGRVAVDENYGGMALGDEAERVCGLLGDKPVLMMGNHGVMVVAPTVARAFDELYILERACETLVKAYMTGKELRIASHEVAQRTFRQWQECAQPAENHFAELLAILDEEEPDYAD